MSESPSTLKHLVVWTYLALNFVVHLEQNILQATRRPGSILKIRGPPVPANLKPGRQGSLRVGYDIIGKILPRDQYRYYLFSDKSIYECYY